jgi:hypothetical protein
MDTDGDKHFRQIDKHEREDDQRRHQQRIQAGVPIRDARYSVFLMIMPRWEQDVAAQRTVIAIVDHSGCFGDYHREGFGFQSAASFFAFAIWSGVILLATLSRYWIA